jgi:hypothetical protein
LELFSLLRMFEAVLTPSLTSSFAFGAAALAMELDLGFFSLTLRRSPCAMTLDLNWVSFARMRSPNKATASLTDLKAREVSTSARPDEDAAMLPGARMAVMGLGARSKVGDSWRNI